MDWIFCFNVNTSLGMLLALNEMRWVEKNILSVLKVIQKSMLDSGQEKSRQWPSKIHLSWNILVIKMSLWL